MDSNSDSASESDSEAIPVNRSVIEAANVLRYRNESDSELDALRRAIAEGCDVDHRESDGEGSGDGYSALHTICTGSRYARQRLACVAALIGAGADVNLPSRERSFPISPITSAVRHCGPEVVRTLIDAGADVTYALPKDSGARGVTPLHTAAIYGKDKTILPLLAAGAVVDAISEIHRDVPETPLDAAIRFKAGQPWGLNGGFDYTRTYAHLVRAGARIPTRQNSYYPLPPYLAAVAKAGGYARYERAHRARLAAIFIPRFPHLPAEGVHHIVGIWADVGGH